MFETYYFFLNLRIYSLNPVKSPFWWKIFRFIVKVLKIYPKFIHDIYIRIIRIINKPITKSYVIYKLRQLLILVYKVLLISKISAAFNLENEYIVHCCWLVVYNDKKTVQQIACVCGWYDYWPVAYEANLYTRYVQYISRLNYINGLFWTEYFLLLFSRSTRTIFCQIIYSCKMYLSFFSFIYHWICAIYCDIFHYIRFIVFLFYESFLISKINVK